MGKKSKRKARRYSDYEPFDKFIRAALRAFRFLIKEFDFEVSSIFEHPKECIVKFQNRTTGVRVGYEIPNLPNVSICQLRKDGSVWGNEYGLIYLVEERCPSRSLQGYREETLTAAQFYPILSHHAEIVKEFAADLLRGDFSVFPQLEKHALKRIRQFQKEQRAKTKRRNRTG